MDVFKQNRYLWITVIILVILNAVTISLLWLGRPPQPSPAPQPIEPERDRHRIERLLREQLGFTDEQIDRYLALRRQHRARTRQLEAEIRQLKREMFDQVLAEKAPASISDSLLSLVLAKQAELEKITFQHFLALKELCGPGQKEKLRLLIREVFRPPIGRQPLRRPVPRSP